MLLTFYCMLLQMSLDYEFVIIMFHWNISDKNINIAPNNTKNFTFDKCISTKM